MAEGPPRLPAPAPAGPPATLQPQRGAKLANLRLELLETFARLVDRDPRIGIRAVRPDARSSSTRAGSPPRSIMRA